MLAKHSFTSQKNKFAKIYAHLTFIPKKLKYLLDKT